MQDFLKDRPSLAPEDPNIFAPAAPAAVAGANAQFARIVRDPSALSAARPAAVPAGKPGAAAPAAAHTSQVKTVVENGRVTRLIVTCSCGKVTEIACTY